MLLALLIACNGDSTESTCPGWGEPEAVGEVANSDLDEISGLAASRTYTSVLWAHNDQGDSARVFALNTTGLDRGEFTISGVVAEDWEDMAIGPGPSAGDWLYVGDIGDNDLSRDQIAVVRFPEPNPGSGGGPVSDAERIHLSYPDRPRNAETLLVDPDSGDLYVLTRADSGPTEVFQVASDDLVDGAVLERVATLALGSDEFAGSSVLRGGSVSPDGRRVWLRTDDSVFLLARAADESLHEALTGTSCVVPAPVDLNGEAIAADSEGYFAAAEGEAATIWRELPESD